MRMPPVLLLLGALGLTYTAATVDPLARSSSVLRLIGGLLAAAGSGAAIAGVAAFRRRRTTVDPRYPERASALVDEGIYRWSRNPMYLGFVSMVVGAATAVGSPFALIGPALLAAYLDRVQIPAEERALHALCGASFELYVRVVRRWFGRRGPSLRDPV